MRGAKGRMGVVFVSFLRPWEFWRAEARRLVCINYLKFDLDGLDPLHSMLGFVFLFLLMHNSFYLSLPPFTNFDMFLLRQFQGHVHLCFLSGCSHSYMVND